VNRGKARAMRTIDKRDQHQSGSQTEAGSIIDGAGIGHEANQLNTSETGYMAGGGGSDVGAIGDFDVAGQGDAEAHQGVGGTGLDYQDPERDPAAAAGEDTFYDPATGMSGQYSDTRYHAGRHLDPVEASDDAHTGAAFPRDPA